MGRKKSIHADNANNSTKGIQRQILTASEIKSRLKENSWLIDGAAPYLNKMHNLLEEKENILILLDAEGCIMHIVASGGVSEVLSSKFIIPGSYPPPSTILFDAVDLAIKNHHEAKVEKGIPLVGIPTEQWACWVFPICTLPNHLIGFIALSTPKKLTSKTLFALLCQTANCIKQELAYHEEKKQAVKLKEQQLNLFNRHAQADIVVNKDGKILLASDEACELLGIGRGEIEKKNISKFLPTWTAISHLDSKWIEVENTEVEVTHVANSGLYLVNSKAILRIASRIEEQVFNLRSMRQVLNESNKYIGNTAYINMDDILGVSVPMKRMLKAAKNIAQNGSPIMLLGEKFTGRETLAQAIHNRSSRASFGFVRVDVSSLPADKMEETLWGFNEKYQPHLKRIPRPGAFEFANGGTLYINEIGLMPRSVQDKIFEVMKTGKISRLGSDISTRVDVRIICSSSMDLSHRIEKNEFRIDLFYALSPASLRVPPLRERRPDIALLLDHYLNIKARELGLKKPSIPKKIMLILRRYEWPENFRELIELSERILVDQGEMFKNFKNERDFKRRHLYLEHLKAVESVITLEDHEKKLVLKAYNAFNGSISKASRALGISRNTLYLKLKKYGVEV